MFKLRHEATARVTILLDGAALAVPEGQSVAAALLSGAEGDFRRTAISGQARAPYCMIGVCFDCLVEIDGTPNRQACMVEVREGMHVRPMIGARDLAEAPADD